MVPARSVSRRSTDEAVELCERVEPSPDHVAAFWGWWRISPGIHAQLERAERLFGLAQRLDDDGVLLQAHHCLWATRFNLGDFRDSWRHIQAGLKLYDAGRLSRPGGFLRRPRRPGLRQRRGGAGPLASRARRSRPCATVSTPSNWSERLGHAGSRLHALDIAVTFRRYRREPEAARELAQRMIDLGLERGLADHQAKGRLYLGWAIAASGEREQGIAMMTEAFAIERGLGHARGFLDLLRHAGRMPGGRRARRDRARRGRAGDRGGRGAGLADLAARAASAARRGPAGAVGTARGRGRGLLRRGACPRAQPAVPGAGAARGHQPRPPVAQPRRSSGLASSSATSMAGFRRGSTRSTCAKPGASSTRWAVCPPPRR